MSLHTVGKNYNFLTKILQRNHANKIPCFTENTMIHNDIEQ